MSYYTIDPVVNGQRKQQVVKVGDTLPVDSIIDYDGDSVPSGWEQVDEVESFTYTFTNGLVLNFYKYEKVVQLEVVGSATFVANQDYTKEINLTLKPFNGEFRNNFEMVEGDATHKAYINLSYNSSTEKLIATLRTRKDYTSTTYPRAEMCYISI